MIDVALLCLALNVYFEARGEPLEGQLAVAEVTLRRASRSGRPLCNEVFTDAQFSWTIDSDELKVRPGKAWEEAQAVAARAIESPPSVTGGATHFHAEYVSPKWARSLCRTVQIGRHIFYKECDK